jgi:hypothetical protein
LHKALIEIAQAVGGLQRAVDDGDGLAGMLLQHARQAVGLLAGGEQRAVAPIPESVGDQAADQRSEQQAEPQQRAAHARGRRKRRGVDRSADRLAQGCTLPRG